MASRGSVTCCESSARLVSKYQRISGGSVSIALLTTSLCPLRPHACDCCGNESSTRKLAKTIPARFHGWQMDHRCILRSLLRTIRGPQCTVPAAIEIIKHQAKDHPNKESDPIHDGQARHQKNTREYREDGSQRAARSPEGSGPVRLSITKDEHTTCDQSERKQRADIGKIRQGTDVEQACGNTHHESCHPCRKVWCLEEGMHATKDSRKEPVARHRKPHTRLTQSENQQRRDHSHQCADQHDQPNSREMKLLQRVDHWSGVVHQRVPSDQTCEHYDHGNIEKCTSHKCGDDADWQVTLRILAFLGSS